MLQQMAGFPLQENLQLFDELADKFEKLPMYFMTFHGQQSIKVVMEVSKNNWKLYFYITTFQPQWSDIKVCEQQIFREGRIMILVGLGCAIGDAEVHFKFGMVFLTESIF